MGYDGTFVARIDGDEKGQLYALIPQVFQGTRVPLDKWAGGRPGFGEEGYVIFINGDPTWPVWMGTQYLSHAVPGSGGGPSTPPEVWVGEEEPSGPYTMWFDTDEHNPAEDGPLWAQGIQGEQGPVGPRGPIGFTGADSTVAGPAGAAGERWFSSAGSPSGGTGVVGDWHLNSVTGDVSEKTGASTWTVVANIKGPAGPAGTGGGGIDPETLDSLVTEDELTSTLVDYVTETELADATSSALGEAAQARILAQQGTPFLVSVNMQANLSSTFDIRVLELITGTALVETFDASPAEQIVAVQAGIDYASDTGGTVLLRPGDYEFDEADLTIPANVTLYRLEHGDYPGYDPVDFLGAGGGGEETTSTNVVVVDADWVEADGFDDPPPVGTRILRRI